ncbi:MAG: prolyl oligopeptidase family serine peptidase [Isosphaeraceae bacterium]|nr:prolyl oligopeptidase family serine peptidase [Isosphaeraceae bacterium]
MQSRIFMVVCCAAAACACRAFGAEPIERTWKVAGSERRALVALPGEGQAKAAPLVFVFHGHGGTMRGAARQFAIERLWPEAVVVYPQGLPTPGRLTDPEGKRAGWQHGEGEQGNRDLAFFDAMFESLKAEGRVDLSRVYATGHSNGGGFTYLLWAERGDVFAAVAPSGSAAAKSAGKLRPKPVMHIAGETDPLVKFAWQKATMERLRKLNAVAGEGRPWGESTTRYESKDGPPVVQYVHPGGHQFPCASLPKVVEFFKEHQNKSADVQATSGKAG